LNIDPKKGRKPSFSIKLKKLQIINNRIHAFHLKPKNRKGNSHRISRVPSLSCTRNQPEDMH